MANDNEKRYIGDTICNVIFRIILSVLLIIGLMPFFAYIMFGVIVNLDSRISENVTVTDSTGDKFKIKIKGRDRGTLTQPSWCYTEISVKYKGAEIVSLGSKESEYRGNCRYPTKLQREYHDGDTHVYQFYFAIVYSLDNKKTFYSVGDKDYDYFYKTDPEFREIYDLLNKPKFIPQ